MIEPLVVTVETVSPPRTSLALGYVPTADIGRQARLRDRQALMPEIDLDRYKCRAEIDWVGLRLHLGRPTQFIWLQRTIETVLRRKCFVRGPQDTGTNTGSAFSVRFQEPRLVRLADALRAIENEFGLEREPEIEGIEISVDFTPKDHTEIARKLLTSVLTRHLWVGPDLLRAKEDRPRCVWGGREEIQSLFPNSKDEVTNVDVLPLRSDLDHPAYVDATFYVGRRGGPVMWRIMEKVIDRQNRTTGSADVLPPKKCRARVEVALMRSELAKIGLRRFEDLRTFNYARLQGLYFRFMLPSFQSTDHVMPLKKCISVWTEKERRAKFVVAGVVGLGARDRAWSARQGKQRQMLVAARLKVRRRQRQGIGPHSTFVAYSRLNRRVEVALRNLSKRSRL